ncbi:uncharacterized protein isoform X2 [Rhodnius prolixus]|uniref:uncharacterized protein isoform X2 n=1 Tax=Rhodnius prolixus TaxID=13249 RepID=UPI003D1896E8
MMLREILIALIKYTLTEAWLLSASDLVDSKLQHLDYSSINLSKNKPVEDGIILSGHCAGCSPVHDSMANYETGCQYSAGEYINICGECVGGQTEKDDDFGADRCGICKGLDRCSSARRGCSQDIEEIDSDLQNCTLLVGIQPRVIDVASADVATVHIITEDSDHPPSVDCVALDKNGEKQGEFDKLQSTSKQLKFKLSKTETKLELSCNSSDGFIFIHTLMVVDSRNLKLLDADRKEIELGRDSKITLTVANIYALSELLCFGKMMNKIVYTSWSNDIQGNSLSSQVTCDNLWPKSDGILNVGVAYSKEALNLVQTVELKVVIPVARVLSAVINKEENEIIVTFNKNVKPVKDCITMFSNPSSYGTGAVCQTLANEIHVELGQDSTLKAGELISVIVKATPNVVQLDSVRLMSLTYNESNQFLKQQSDILEITGPSLICPNVLAEFSVPAESQSTVWSLSYITSLSSKFATSPGQTQRLNLMLWRSLREMQRTWRGNSPNTVNVNASLLIPGIDYQLKATTFLDDKMVTANKIIRVSHDQGTSVILRGPRRVSWNALPTYQASLVQCSERSLQSVKYLWKMTAGSEDELSNVDGGPIYTADKSLSPNSNYRLSLDIFNGDQLVAQNAMDINTVIDDFQILLPFDEAVFGTGHKIIIDTYVLGGFLPSSVNFKWACLAYNGSPCVVPGKEGKFINSLETTSSSFRLNAGSLPVGRYYIHVQASLPGGYSSSADCLLIIVGGEPPIIRITQPPTLSNSGQSVVKISVNDLIADCRIEVRCLPATGTVCPNDKHIQTQVPNETLQGTPYKPKSSNIVLRIMPLQYRAKYKFRVTVDCGPIAQSLVTFTVPMIGIMQTDSLMVEPTSGVALKTDFTFKLNERKLAAKDFIYSYGYLLGNKEIYLVTSLEPQSSLFAPPGKLKALVNICNMKGNCWIVTGPEVKVDSTNTYDPERLNSIVSDFKEQLFSFRYKEALGIVEALRTALNQTATKQLFSNTSAQIGNVLTNRIIIICKRMQENYQRLATAVQLLDLSVSALEMIEISDSLLSRILEFRDAIQSVVKQKNDKYKESESSNISAEPRIKRSFRSIIARSRRKTETQINEISSYMKTSALAIQQFSNNETMLKSEVSALLEHLPEYLNNLCQELGDAKPSVFIGTKVAEISSIKLRKSGNKHEIKITECDNKCGNSTAQLILTKPLLEKYKGSDSICVASSIFYDDLLSINTNYSSEEYFGRWSAVYGVMIYSYINDSISKPEVDNSTKKPLAVIKIPLWPGKIPQGNEVKCHSWNDNMAWNWRGCKTAKQTVVNNKEIIECRCPIPGYVSLIAISSNDSSAKISATLKNTTSSSSTSGSTTLSTPLKINEKYDEKVANQSEKVANQFEKVANQSEKVIKANTEPPTDQLDLPEAKNQETSYDTDKIKVHLKLLEENLKNISSSLDSLAHDFAKGTRYDVDHNKLDVPAQQLDVTKTKNETPSEYTALVAIGLICPAVLLSVIIIGQFIRKKREQRAIRFLQGLDSPTPKYLRLTETTSMNRLEQTYTADDQRAGRELESGVVLTVDANRMSSKYNEPRFRRFLPSGL